MLITRRGTCLGQFQSNIRNMQLLEMEERAMSAGVTAVVCHNPCPQACKWRGMRRKTLSRRNTLLARRVYSLGRLVDAAFDNLGRIRLVWARLWAALAAHLVSAACHPEARVSVLAVGHLRALVTKLLSRAELSCFTHQARLGISAFPSNPLAPADILSVRLPLNHGTRHAARLHCTRKSHLQPMQQMLTCSSAALLQRCA